MCKTIYVFTFIDIHTRRATVGAKLSVKVNVCRISFYTMKVDFYTTLHYKKYTFTM